MKRRERKFFSIFMAAGLALTLVACAGPVDEARAKKDLAGQIELLAGLESLETGTPVELAGSPGGQPVVAVPFQARVRAREPLRNFVQYAREGKYHREYVGWVKENSVSGPGRERLRAFSLLANLAASPAWYDVKADETFAIEGALRYRTGPSGPEFVALVESD